MRADLRSCASAVLTCVPANVVCWRMCRQPTDAVFVGWTSTTVGPLAVTLLGVPGWSASSSIVEPRSNLNATLTVMNGQGAAIRTASGVGVGPLILGAQAAGQYYASIEPCGGGAAYSSYGSLGQYELVVTYATLPPTGSSNQVRSTCGRAASLRTVLLSVGSNEAAVKQTSEQPVTALFESPSCIASKAYHRAGLAAFTLACCCNLQVMGPSPYPSPWPNSPSPSPLPPSPPLSPTGTGIPPLPPAANVMNVSSVVVTRTATTRSVRGRSQHTAGSLLCL